MDRQIFRASKQWARDGRGWGKEGKSGEREMIVEPSSRWTFNGHTMTWIPKPPFSGHVSSHLLSAGASTRIFVEWIPLPRHASMLSRHQKYLLPANELLLFFLLLLFAFHILGGILLFLSERSDLMSQFEDLHSFICHVGQIEDESSCWRGVTPWLRTYC